MSVNQTGLTAEKREETGRPRKMCNDCWVNPGVVPVKVGSRLIMRCNTCAQRRAAGRAAIRSQKRVGEGTI